MRKYILLFIFLHVCLLSVYSQQKNNNQQEAKIDTSRIDEQYKLALKCYKLGQIDSSLFILRRCISRNMAMVSVSSQTKGNMYRLAALSSMLVDSGKEANSYIKKMLEYQPFYKDENLNDDDLELFRAAVAGFTLTPQITVGLRAGVNIPQYSIVKSYNIFDTEKATKETPVVSFNVGATASYGLTKNISLVVEPEYIQCSSKSEIARSSISPELGNIKTKLQIGFISVPVLARFGLTLKKGELTPYIEAGAFYSYLVSATKTIDTEEFPIDLFLSKNNVGVLFGAGCIRNHKTFGIGVNVRYMNNLSLTNSEEKRFLYDYSNDNMLYKYYNVFDDFKLRNFELSVTFTYNMRFKVF